MLHVDVYLRDMETGDTRVFHETTFEVERFDKNSEEWESLFYIWTDGNWSCDCNRSLFLWPDKPENELLCNTCENRIVIDKMVIRETGEIAWEPVEADAKE